MALYKASDNSIHDDMGGAALPLFQEHLGPYVEISEQEAEQLAMQLQNAWTVGYQKGLAAAREQAQAQEQASAPAASAAENVQNQKPAPAAGPTPPGTPRSGLAGKRRPNPCR